MQCTYVLNTLFQEKTFIKKFSKKSNSEFWIWKWQIMHEFHIKQILFPWTLKSGSVWYSHPSNKRVDWVHFLPAFKKLFHRYSFWPPCRSYFYLLEALHYGYLIIQMSLPQWALQTQINAVNYCKITGIQP